MHCLGAHARYVGQIWVKGIRLSEQLYRDYCLESMGSGRDLSVSTDIQIVNIFEVNLY